MTNNDIEPLRRYYSQHGEDYLLWKFFDFKKDGFFVEVGAFDGVHLSNTYSFELEGWKGICVEPGQYFENCKKNRPNSICINAACVNSDDIKEVTFYEEELGLLSSLDMSTEKKEDIEKRYENRKLNFSGHKEKTVKAQTLNSILEENNVSKIDFITIDVEGAEIEVLKGFNLKKHKPKVVILEANDEEHKKELLDYMTVQNSYVFVREVSVNLVFVSSQDDLHKMKNIEINCTIEKQVHPLGKEHTLQSHFDGKKIGSQADLVFNDELILIYQVGKVGSSSIFQSLKELNLKNQDIFQVHNIALAEELMSKELKKGFYDGKHHFQDGIKVKKLLQNNSYKKIKVIVGVREPIARWISDIFQNINERYAFLRNEYGQVDVEKTIKYIKTTLEDEPFNTWFDSELKSTFGIDVFQYDFSKTKGFEVFSKDNVDFFIYKLEMLNSLEEELKKFLLVNDFKLTIVNESSNKVYDNDYKLVKKFFKVDEEVLIEYYKRSEIAQYFYNDDEIATFIKKWSGNNYNKNQELEQKQKVIEQKNNELKEKNQELEQKQKVIEQKNNELKEKNQELEQKQKVIEQKNNELKEKNQELEQKQKVIEQKNNELKVKQEMIERQSNNFNILMEQIKNLTTTSIKTQPLQKIKNYKELIQLYHQMKGRE